MIKDSYNLIEKIKLASGFNYEGIEPWLYEIDNTKDILNCCKDYNIEIPSLEVIQGYMEKDLGLLNILNENQIFDKIKQQFEIADQINAQYLIITPPFSHRGYNNCWKASVERYVELYDFCIKNFHCKPALEFMGQTKLINNFDKCVNFLNDIKCEDAKIIIDSYHLWRGGSDMNDFKNFNTEHIALFHISDACKDIVKELHRDRDRVLPLDGQIDLFSFAQTIKKINYNGYISVGVYNPSIAECSSDYVLRETKRRLDILFN
jgi:2-keto-myo-inositol isomerase